ncbi:hypothetical protein BGZ74_007481 [Mortierella antarctica]|nr:hypothetical protein BGZ74_007481 [Mortierella antarctica]
MAIFDANHAGMTSSPKTALTKCLLTSGESVILSTSAIRFIVPSREMFRSVATSIFGMQDELVLGMEDSVNNSTLTTLPANVLEELTVMEVKVIGTEVAALSQPMNPDVARRLVNKGLNPSWTNVTITMVLSYLPRVSNDDLSFAIPKILNASAEAVDYFASLGNNFVLDWEGSMLYVAFDTIEILKGYEIPRWLFFSMIGVMVLTAGKDGAKPRLHSFDPKTLKFKFEGRRRLIVSTSLPQASGDTTVYQNPTPADSQDPLMAVAV